MMPPRRSPLRQHVVSNHQKKDKVIGRRQHIPERTCVGCRTKQPPHALLRLVSTPQGNVIPTYSRHLPGRGAYVCYDLECIQRALKPGKLAAAFKHAVTTPSFEVFCRSVVPLLSHRLGSLVSMAHKAGTAISGGTPLKIAMAQQRVLYLIFADDIAASRAQEYRRWCAEHNVPWTILFPQAELGNLIGKASRSAIGLSSPQFRDLIAPAATFFTTLRTALGSAALSYNQPIPSLV